MYGTPETIAYAVLVTVVVLLTTWGLIAADRWSRRPDNFGDYLDRQPACAVDGCDLKASARDRGRLVCHRHNRTGVALNG